MDSSTFIHHTLIPLARSQVDTWRAFWHTAIPPGILISITPTCKWNRTGTSSITGLEQSSISAISTFGLLLLLWIIDWAGNGDNQASGLFAYLSMLRHYETLLKGQFNSTDVAYYLLVIILFLVLSIRRLDADRLSH